MDHRDGWPESFEKFVLSKLQDDDDHDRHIPAYWPNGYSVNQWFGWPGFNPESSHCKDSKTDTCSRLA